VYAYVYVHVYKYEYEHVYTYEYVNAPPASVRHAQFLTQCLFLTATLMYCMHLSCNPQSDLSLSVRPFLRRGRAEGSSYFFLPPHANKMSPAQSFAHYLFLTSTIVGAPVSVSEGMCMCKYIYVYVRACAYVCVCVYVRACACVWVCVYISVPLPASVGIAQLVAHCFNLASIFMHAPISAVGNTHSIRS
jgi:hypothetical protein